MHRKLFADDLNTFFESLKKFGRVQGPVSTGSHYSQRLLWDGHSHIQGPTSMGSYEFKSVNFLDDVHLNYNRTGISPKKFFLKEAIFEFDEEKAEFKEILDKDEKTVILGIHPCDIHATNFLDKVYMNETPDKYYMKRRENTLFIGVSCHPDGYCFCKSTGTSYATDGFDLFLHQIDDGYFVRIGSEKGYEITALDKNLFKNVEAKDIEEFKSNERKRLEEFTLELNVLGLQDKLDLAYDNDLWKKTADVCFSCGTCNLVCPTCRCYDVVDYLNLDLKTGERARRWDSCMLRKHGLVAGGLNFRPTRVERLLNRFNCKGSLREGILNCVGCGRCTVYCPADIDFVAIMKRVNGEL